MTFAEGAYGTELHRRFRAFLIQARRHEIVIFDRLISTDGIESFNDPVRALEGTVPGLATRNLAQLSALARFGERSSAPTTLGRTVG